jgi:hypothetical protein
MYRNRYKTIVRYSSGSIVKQSKMVTGLHENAMAYVDFWCRIFHFPNAGLAALWPSLLRASENYQDGPPFLDHAFHR